MDAVTLTDDFFRHESGKLVSVLVRMLGAEHLALAEDVVQEALIRAMRTWPYHGVPENPAGWITQTAKNLAIDAMRRENLFRQKQISIFGSTHRWSSQIADTDFDVEIDDAVLRLMFVCSHPSVPPDAQPLLALKTLCGFGTGEIANAFLTSEAAVQKRLTRAKEKLREENVPTELVVGDDLTERLDGVLKTIYLLFNEGYKATSGENLIREELCSEAIRLATLVARHKAGDQPQTHALLALMLFNSARFATRVDENGEMLQLKDQDRSRWDRSKIDQGLAELGKSAQSERLSSLHLQAAIAAVHCTAAEFESTDWRQILSLYDLLASIDSSPVVALNRAVVLGEVSGPRAGIEALERISNREALERYYLLYAVLAHFEIQLGELEAARLNLKKAIELTDSESERILLTKRVQTLS